MTIQAANERLAKRPKKAIEKALEKLISIGLLSTFEHQGRTYVCQLDWQDWQKVRYPRATVNPQPPADVLLRCGATTQKLFRVQAQEHRGDSGDVAETVPRSSGDSSETSPPPTRAGARERQRLTATATAQKEPDDEISDELAERAHRLLDECYPAWYAQFRHGARLRLMKNSLNFGDAVTVCGLWDDARIAKLAQVFLTTDDPWISGTDRSFKIFAMKASWCDDRLAQAERQAV